MKEKKLRNIPHGELTLMMERLVLKVQEEPEWFDGWANGNLQRSVSNFIDGENSRRKLFINE